MLCAGEYVTKVHLSETPNSLAKRQQWQQLPSMYPCATSVVLLHNSFSITREDLQDFSQLPKLQHLEFVDRSKPSILQNNSGDWVPYESLTSLTSLTMSCMDMFLQMQRISVLTQLCDLKLLRSKDFPLWPLCKLSALTSLNTHYPEGGLAVLSQLRSLTLRSVDVLCPSSFCFTKLTSLTRLSLTIQRQHEGVQHRVLSMKSLVCLQSLALHLNFADDPARMLSGLCLLPALNSFELVVATIGDTGLWCIGLLTKLTHLGLGLEMSYNPRGHPLTQLGTLTHLNHLHLELLEHPGPGSSSTGAALMMAMSRLPMSHCRVMCRGRLKGLLWIQNCISRLWQQSSCQTTASTNTLGSAD